MKLRATPKNSGRAIKMQTRYLKPKGQSNAIKLLKQKAISAEVIAQKHQERKYTPIWGAELTLVDGSTDCDNVPVTLCKIYPLKETTIKVRVFKSNNISWQIMDIDPLFAYLDNYITLEQDQRIAILEHVHSQGEV